MDRYLKPDISIFIDKIDIVTDIYLEHQFSKISEPFLRTSKQLHLEHQKSSKYALRTSEKTDT